MYLEHHGVKGMQWGVRRYQNYDGTYTRKGLQHYKESEASYKIADDTYKAAKKIYKDTKKKGYSEDHDGTRLAIHDKNVLKQAKQERKIAKKRLNADYDQLKRDKLADEGKKLYNSGKTITGNEAALGRAKLVALGATAASTYLAKNGKKKEAEYVAAAALGLEALNAITFVKNESQARKLRAYYSHNRNYRNW